MENIETAIKKNGAINGLLLGAIILVLNIFLFYYMTSMTTSFWMISIVGPMLFTVLMPLAAAVYFCFDLRKKIGGYWVFKQAVTGIFVMFIVSYLISFSGNLFFSKVIEPNMADKLKSTMLTGMEKMMEKQHVDQSIIDKKVEDITKQFDQMKKQEIGGLLKNLGITIIFTFVLAIIFAAFFKQDPPLFDTPPLTGEEA